MNIIFDFDGTIGDTADDFLPMANKVAEELGFKEIKPEDFERARNFPPRQVLKELNIPLRAVPKIRLAGHREAAKRKDTTKLITGMKEVVIELSKGHTLSILTSNDAQIVIDILTRHGIIEHFDFVNSAVSIFGKHRALNKIIKRQKYSRDETIYIGDEIRDIEGAKKANVQSIAVTWGFNREGILSQYEPTHLVKKPTELIDFLQS